MSHDTTDPSRPAGFTRRSLTKAAAWSVPIVAIAIAAPAASASNEFSIAVIYNQDTRTFSVTVLTGIMPEGTGFMLTETNVNLGGVYGAPTDVLQNNPEVGASFYSQSIQVVLLTERGINGTFSVTLSSEPLYWPTNTVTFAWFNLPNSSHPAPTGQISASFNPAA